MLSNLQIKFDENGLDLRKTVVRCETQDEANAFLEYLCAKGVWKLDQIQELKRRWSEYKCSTCYHIGKNSWCHDVWYKERGYYVVDFSDIYIGSIHIDAINISLGYDELFE